MKTFNLKSWTRGYGFSLFLFYISLYTSGQTTITWSEEPIKDAWVEQLNPNTNYGSDQGLYVGRDAGGEGNNILIQWDLSSLPDCIEIVDAYFQLYQWTNNSGNCGAKIKKISNSWDESSVNWANQPSASGDYGTQYFNSEGWHDIPATDIVTDLLLGDNFGIKLEATTASTCWQAVQSRENIQHNPVLHITYNVGINSTTPSYANAFPDAIYLGESTTLSVAGGSLGTGANWEWYSLDCGVTHVGTGSSINLIPPSLPIEYFVRAEGDCNVTECASVTVQKRYTEIYDYFINDQYRVFPNPVINSFTINRNLLEAKSIKIIDQFGNSIYVGSLNEKCEIIDISRFSKGVYLLILKDFTGKTLYKQRIVKL